MADPRFNDDAMAPLLGIPVDPIAEPIENSATAAQPERPEAKPPRHDRLPAEEADAEVASTRPHSDATPPNPVRPVGATAAASAPPIENAAPTTDFEPKFDISPADLGPVRSNSQRAADDMPMIETPGGGPGLAKPLEPAPPAIGRPAESDPEPAIRQVTERITERLEVVTYEPAEAAPARQLADDASVAAPAEPAPRPVAALTPLPAAAEPPPPVNDGSHEEEPAADGGGIAIDTVLINAVPPAVPVARAHAPEPPRTAAAASIIGPLPARRSTKTLFGMRLR